MAEHREKPDSESPQGSEESGKKSPPPSPGWIENLALRSTGLPQPEDLRPAEPKEQSPWKYAGLGLQFAGLVSLFTFMGYELDKHMGWFPWSTVTLSMIAVIGNLYLLIKELVMEPKGPSKDKKT